MRAQREALQFFVDRLQARGPGLIESSRDYVMLVLSKYLAGTLCLRNPGMAISVISREQDPVDCLGDSDSLLYTGDADATTVKAFGILQSYRDAAARMCGACRGNSSSSEPRLLQLHPDLGLPHSSGCAGGSSSTITT
jgi:hypothetical protein